MEVLPVTGFEWIAECASDTYSQFGEDGMVDAILRTIGEANRWCFEAGASDGVFYSNTRRLYENGWACVLVEVNPEKYGLLIQNAHRAMTLNDAVGPLGVSIDWVLEYFGSPRDPDLLIIDIDGQDYWALEELNRHFPRVLMVEYQCPDMDADPPERGDTACRQAGSSAMIGLMEEKGYTVVARTCCNLIGVRSELADLLRR